MKRVEVKRRPPASLSSSLTSAPLGPLENNNATSSRTPSPVPTLSNNNAGPLASPGRLARDKRNKRRREKRAAQKKKTADESGLGTEAAADGQFPWERAGLTREERMDLCKTHYKDNILHKLDGTTY